MNEHSFILSELRQEIKGISSQCGKFSTWRMNDGKSFKVKG